MLTFQRLLTGVLIWRRFGACFEYLGAFANCLVNLWVVHRLQSGVHFYQSRLNFFRSTSDDDLLPWHCQWSRKSLLDGGRSFLKSGSLYVLFQVGAFILVHVIHLFGRHPCSSWCTLFQCTWAISLELLPTTGSVHLGGHFSATTFSGFLAVSTCLLADFGTLLSTFTAIIDACFLAAENDGEVSDDAATAENDHYGDNAYENAISAVTWDVSFFMVFRSWNCLIIRDSVNSRHNTLRQHDENEYKLITMNVMQKRESSFI